MAVIAIFGPTASGKSAVALELADLVGGEIVSCDAMQLYRGLPILTNQPPPADRERVAHHLVAVWEPSHEGSVAEYADLAHEAIDEILDRGRIPIVCGGSGLYMRSALADMPLPPQAPDGVRDAAERLYDERGPAGAHATLAAVDAPAAAAVHPNDRRRVVRALELAESGHSLTASESALWSAETRHPTAVAGLTLPPAVDGTADRGANCGDVRGGRRRRGSPRSIGLHLLEHRQNASTASRTSRRCLPEGIDCEEASRRVEARTRRYAKRQRTWMRRLPGVKVVEAAT